jgi:septation ring formation regulator EzrA|tara:strand:- start:192 stop:479 length:288 start_codon:yes stop_codon:yes gene_type:complete
MENLIKELEAIMYDVKDATSRTSDYKLDIDVGIDTNHHRKSENVPKAQTIASLMCYLIDAKHDMDRVEDGLKDIHNKLDTLLDMVEYEAVAKEIR